MYIRAFIISILLLLPNLLAESLEPDLSIENWSLARFRYGQGDFLPKTVETKFTIKNISTNKMRRIKVEINYLSPNGKKVFKPKAVTKSFLEPGKKFAIKYRDGKVPVFTACELHISYYVNSKPIKLLYFGQNAYKTPELLDERMFQNSSRLYVLGDELKLARKKQSKLMLRVKNLGGKESKDIVAKIKFYNNSKKLIQKIEKKLKKETIKSKETKTIYITLDNVRPHKSYAVELSDSFSKLSLLASLPPGEFSNEETLEMANFKFSKDDKKNLVIEADLRNGTQSFFKEITAIVELTDQNKVVKKVNLKTDEIKVGDTKRLRTILNNPPKFSGYSYFVQGNEEQDESTEEIVLPEVPSNQVGAKAIERIEHADKIVFKAHVINRTKSLAKNVSVTIELLAKDEKTLLGKCTGQLTSLGAGEEKNVIVSSKKIISFETYRYTVQYNK